MLYNGIELPALPELDKETYPYAVIVRVAESAKLYCSSVPLYFESATASSFPYKLLSKLDGAYKSYQYNTVDDMTTWAILQADGTMTAGNAVYSNLHTPIWANYDLLNYADDSLYLAASDPIPVTTAAPIDPTSFMQGWLVGRRIAAMRGKPKEEV